MASKWNDIDAGQQEYYLAVFDSISADEKDLLKERIKIAKSFDLDLADSNVMQIIRNGLDGLPVNNTPKPNASIDLPKPITSEVSLPVTEVVAKSDGKDLVTDLLKMGAFDELLSDDKKTTTELQVVDDSSDNTSTELVERAANKAERIYGENWVVLQNRLLNAISNLDLNERRFILFISSIVRKTVDADPNQRTFVARVADYAAAYNLTVNGYYAEFERIVVSLQTKFYMFWDWDNNCVAQDKVRVNWITKGRYKKRLGEVHFDLHNDVVEMLSVFDKSNPFTKYQRDSIINLGSDGIILFELITSCMYQKNKSKVFTANYLREKFNCIDTYVNFYDFKRYVIDKAIKEIEKHTPYRIEYKQNISGKAVQSLTFRFSSTEEANNEDEGLPFYKMSKSQLDKFSNMLARHAPVSKFAIGESNRSFDVFALQIAKELQDADAQPKYHRYLEELGFKIA